MAESKKIDFDRLKDLTFYGISDEIKGLRPLIWRILLNYLPPDDSDEWEDILRQKKAIYEMWKEELIVKPKLSIQERFGSEEA